MTSAHRIIRHLIRVNDSRVTPISLAIQRELIDENRTLGDTTAGRVVLDAAARKYAEAKEEIASLKVAIKKSDKENAQALRQMKDDNERMIKALGKTQKKMDIRAQKIADKEQALVVGLWISLPINLSTNSPHIV